MLRRALTRSFKMGPLSQECVDRELRYGCHNYGPTPAVICKGLGAEVWDVEGKRYIDCISGISAVNQGHCHPKIKEAAFAQMDRVTMTSRAFFNDQLGVFEKYLTTLLGYDKVCFMNGGVEAIDTAIKFSRRWGYEEKKIPDGQATVVFPTANFWGRSIAACASSDDPKRFNKFGPFNGLNFDLVQYGNIHELEEVFKANPYVVAFVLESIQGEAGVILPPSGYMKKVRELCTKYNVLMVIDEVQAGLGRAGKLLGIQWEEGVRPDIITLGKSLSGGFYPISACVADDKVMQHIHPGDHGSTFGGNPLASAIGVAAVKVIIDEKLPENSVLRGDFIRQNMTELRKQYPALTDFRGRGLFLAMEFDKKYKKTAKEFNLRMVEEGLLSCVSKENMIRIMPPLVLSQNQSEEIVEKLHKILKTF